MIVSAVAAAVVIWVVRDDDRSQGWNEHGAYKRPLSDPKVAWIHGRALRGSRGVGGVEIEAIVLPTGMGWTVDTVTTRDDGTFDLPVTSNHLEHRQLVELYAHGAASSHAYVELAPGQVLAGVTIQVGAGFQIRGKVVDRDGAPVPGVHVRSGTERRGAAAVTGSAGQFTLVLKTPGRHRLRVYRDSQRDDELPQLELPPRSFDVAELDGEVDDVMLSVDPDPDVSGVVIDESGRPVAGATLQQLRTVATTAPADATGRFRWRPVGSPPYVVSATADGRAGYFSGDDVPRRNLTIRIVPVGQVTVHCGGFPATSIDISREHFGVQPHCEDEVILPPGMYQVLGRAHDGALALAMATVVAGHSTAVTLLPAHWVKLRTRMKAHGEDAPEPEGWCIAQLSLAVMDEYETDHDPYSSSKEVALKAPAGPIRITCDPAGFVPSALDVVARDGELVEVPVVPVLFNGVDLGAELGTLPDGALVIGVADEAAAAGLLPGDVVVGVGGTSVVGMNARSVFELGFNVPAGHEVTWTVMRHGQRLELHAKAPGARTAPLYFR